MDEPIILAGSPDSISGVLPYRNTTSKPVTITEVAVDDDDSSTTLVLEVNEATVAPGRRHDIAVRLQLPPHTPPGAYPLAVTVGGTTLPAVAQVAAAHETGLSPTVIVVADLPGATVTETIVVANIGNVDVSVAEFGAVPLHREDAARTTLVRLATARLLDDVDVAALPEATATIQVVPIGGRQVVEPGASRVVELAITLPKQLSPAVRWLASVPISTRSLLITVVPAGSASAESPPDPDLRLTETTDRTHHE